MHRFFTKAYWFSVTPTIDSLYADFIRGGDQQKSMFRSIVRYCSDYADFELLKLKVKELDRQLTIAQQKLANIPAATPPLSAKRKSRRKAAKRVRR